jgi:hypothetical protein
MQLKPLAWHGPCCMAWTQVLERGYVPSRRRNLTSSSVLM